ncbi:Spy/CpxP family protein refolding chaperone [Methylobacterium sp. NEAU K]|uniref:Spy/CpxP family protein refolding chaperone n=1 Tax=Methylobacterium sp. NEAU K TaxID=3064946 RepID=UPI00273649F0|nr:Spy/CpxP family protein refolding chaperone [Methylobacterium sp. NEAU K]MDP4004336.1 Spy/CpxP family protein refolding chaperone [Methylobacterium sp. NEAU K]
MKKLLLIGFSSLLSVSSSGLHAQGVLATHVQERAKEILNAVDWKALTDARIDLVKTALQLTPDQAKYWPAVENAIRARSQARHARLEILATPRTERRDPIEFLRDRADNLSQRATNLKNLADAWQPLYQTLDPTQKLRMRILTIYALREMRDGIESRRLQNEDDDDDES